MSSSPGVFRDIATTWGGEEKDGLAVAALIVRAVNAHEKLVELAEFIRDGYSSDISHVDFRVQAYQLALKAIANLKDNPNA